jgi:hypothetical protein
MSAARSRPRRATALMAVGTALTLTGGVVALGPPAVTASSHREAPQISGLPQYDTTDVYAFRSPDRPDTVTLIANWIPFEEPAGGPNFYLFADDARYDINIDNDGDARPDITYRWTFRTTIRNGDTFLYNTGVVTSLADPDLNIRQTYNLDVLRDGGAPTRLASHVPVAPSFVGKASMPQYGALRRAAVTRVGSLKTFAGQADDPFFLDLRVFDLLYGGDLSEVGDDTLAGFSVNSVALQVPISSVTAARNKPVIGVWSTTSRRNASGNYVQISRLGMPLVNEVVIPLKDKDRFNASRPVNDAQFLRYVTDPELARLIEAIYGIPAPATPRNDLVQVFLTGVPGLNQPPNVRPSEMLRLNTSTAATPINQGNRLGVIGGDTRGFPNGRRLVDDVVDIELQVVEGELVGNPNDLGDAVNRNDDPFLNAFPYLALPDAGSDPEPHNSGFTPLTGGRAPDVPATPTSLPAAGVGVMAAGLLLLVAGAAVTRRARWSHSAVSA